MSLLTWRLLDEFWSNRRGAVGRDSLLASKYALLGIFRKCLIDLQCYFEGISELTAAKPRGEQDIHPPPTYDILTTTCQNNSGRVGG
jgi:hypothetical protein